MNGSDAVPPQSNDKSVDELMAELIEEDEQIDLSKKSPLSQRIANNRLINKFAEIKEEFPDDISREKVDEKIEELWKRTPIPQKSADQKFEVVFTEAAQQAMAGETVQLSPMDLYELDTDKDKYKYTDIGVAERFFNEYRDQVFYNPLEKVWHVWNGKYWECDILLKTLTYLKTSLKKSLIKAADSFSGKDMKFYIKCCSSGKIDGILRISRDHFVVHPDTLDTKADIFLCQNGTLNLKTLQFEENKFYQDHYITKMSGVVYDPAAECPLWKEHLNKIFAGNEKLIKSFQMCVGITLLGTNNEQIVVITHGNGKNGKSVTQQTLSTIFGDYCRNAAPETFLSVSGRNTRGDIVRLKNTRMVTTSEFDENQAFSESMIKQMTGGEPVTVRALYSQEIQFIPSYIVWMSTNHLPKITGTEEAIWRRIVLIPFDVFIKEEERVKGIQDILIAESSGIFNWILKGLREYIDAGKLELADEIKDAVKVYKSQSDVLFEWKESNTELDPRAKTNRADLAASYKTYCDFEDTQPIKNEVFYAKLRECGIKTDGVWISGKRAVKGIRLLTPEERKDRQAKLPQ
jgi:putative DNA primase/helicase